MFLLLLREPQDRNDQDIVLRVGTPAAPILVLSTLPHQCNKQFAYGLLVHFDSIHSKPNGERFAVWRKRGSAHLLLGEGASPIPNDEGGTSQRLSHAANQDMFIAFRPS